MKNFYQKIISGFTRTLTLGEGRSKLVCGFTIIEVLIACSIISIFIFALMSVASGGIKLSSLALKQTQASFILEEGVESVKSIRDSSWTNISNLTLGTEYYLTFNNTSNFGTLETTSNTIDSTFTRKVVFSAVYRDANNDIASSGTLDTHAKKVTVTVSWVNSGVTSSKDLSFYLIDIFN